SVFMGVITSEVGPSPLPPRLAAPGSPPACDTHGYALDHTPSVRLARHIPRGPARLQEILQLGAPLDARAVLSKRSSRKKGGLARGSDTSGSVGCDTSDRRVVRSRTASTRRRGRPGRASGRRRSTAGRAVARARAPAADAPPPRGRGRSSPPRAREPNGWNS